MSSIALMLCFFAESVIQFTICWGGVYGLGFGLGSVLIPPILNQHFEKRTSLANGITLGGECLAGFTLPVLVDFLLKHYGLPGAMLILSGLMLQSVPLAMLLQKPESGDPLGRKEDENGGVRVAGETISEGFDDAGSVDCSTVEHNSHSPTQRNYGNCNNLQEARKYIENDCSLPSPELAEKNKYGVYSSESSEKDTKVELNLSVLKLNVELKLDPTIKNFEENRFTEISEGIKTFGDKNGATVHSLDFDFHRSNTEMFSRNISNLYCDKISNAEQLQNQSRDNNKDIPTNTPSDLRQTLNSFKTLNVFMDPAFVLILLNQSSLLYIFTFVSTIIVDFSKDSGVEDNQVAYLLITMAITDGIGRFFLGIVTDSGLLSYARFCFLGYTGMGVAILLLNWFGGFNILIIVLSFYGLFFGGILCVTPGVCSKSILPEQLTVALTSRFFLYPLMSFTQAPLVGLFRSQGGSYKPIITLLSVLSFACALMSAAIPSAVRRRNERRKNTICGREGELAT